MSHPEDLTFENYCRHEREINYILHIKSGTLNHFLIHFFVLVKKCVGCVPQNIELAQSMLLNSSPSINRPHLRKLTTQRKEKGITAMVNAKLNRFNTKRC